MDESINLLEKAKKNWENGFGLLIAIFLLIVGYFIIADYLFPPLPRESLRVVLQFKTLKNTNIV